MNGVGNEIAVKLLLREKGPLLGEWFGITAASLLHTCSLLLALTNRYLANQIHTSVQTISFTTPKSPKRH